MDVANKRRLKQLLKEYRREQCDKAEHVWDCYEYDKAKNGKCVYCYYRWGNDACFINEAIRDIEQELLDICD